MLKKGFGRSDPAFNSLECEGIKNEAGRNSFFLSAKKCCELTGAVQGELDRVSQILTGRIRELPERYATPLPLLTDEVAMLAARVEGHLMKMGVQ